MQVLIEKLDHQGQGIAYVDGLVTFIPKTIPGDLVKIKITKQFKNYNQGQILEMVTASPNREAAFCPFYAQCGGCHLQNLSYAATLNYKKEKVINIFAKQNLLVDPIVIANPHPQYYRNKIELKSQNGQLGFYEKATNKLVVLNKCMITSQEINAIIPILAKLKFTGDITIRSNLKGEVLLILKTQENINISALTSFKNVKGIILNAQLVYGQDYLMEEINGLKFKITYDAFFQVNPFIAESLFQIISENIRTQDTVLDLYSGVGTLTLNAALKAQRALGIEIILNATKDAQSNALLNKLKNVSFICSNVEKQIAKIQDNYHTWIVDPPRKGLDSKTIDVISRRRPRNIIYVSCNVHTLVRDIGKIQEIYEIEKIYVLDMFSYTYHEEVLCLLKRR